MRMLTLFAFGILWAQDVLTNESVIKLVQSGMSEDLILNVIRQQPGTYSLGADQLIALKTAGVSEKVIAAMLGKVSGKEAAAPGAKAPSSETKLPAEPAVYYRKGAEWLPLIAETVDWKSTGGMKNFVSAGIVKKDLKGSLAGINSRNLVSADNEVIIVPPQGVSVNDYLLIPMKGEKGKREFQVKPAGRNEAVARGAEEFGLEKVGDNHYRVVTTRPLPPGEYGILPLSSVGSETGMSRMFTFRRLP
jgi:hypothetical protein